MGTPGRVKQLISEGILSVDNVRLGVLDEADKMLEPGFINDTTWILNSLPISKQVMAASDWSLVKPSDWSGARPVRHLPRQAGQPRGEVHEVTPAHQAGSVKSGESAAQIRRQGESEGGRNWL